MLQWKALCLFFYQGKVAKSVVSPGYRIYFHNRQICHHQRRFVFSEGNEITYLSASKAPRAGARVQEAAGSVLVSAAQLPEVAALIPPCSKQIATSTSPTQTCTTPTACDCRCHLCSWNKRHILPAHGRGLQGATKLQLPNYNNTAL